VPVFRLPSSFRTFVRSARRDQRRTTRADRFEQWQELRREVDYATRTAAERKRTERSGSKLMREIKTWHRKR
jgi:hypothetical protein